MGKDRRFNQMKLGNRGGVMGWLLFWIVVLGLGGYALYLFFFPKYSYSIIRNQAYSVVNMPGLQDGGIRVKMETEAAAQEVELNEENFQITRIPDPDHPGRGGKPRLVISWEHDVEAFGFYITTLSFNIDTAEPR